MPVAGGVVPGPMNCRKERSTLWLSLAFHFKDRTLASLLIQPLRLIELESVLLVKY
jgi:hypothetical protein